MAAGIAAERSLPGEIVALRLPTTQAIVVASHRCRSPGGPACGQQCGLSTERCGQIDRPIGRTTKCATRSTAGRDYAWQYAASRELRSSACRRVSESPCTPDGRAWQHNGSRCDSDWMRQAPMCFIRRTTRSFISRRAASSPRSARGRVSRRSRWNWRSHGTWPTAAPRSLCQRPWSRLDLTSRMASPSRFGRTCRTIPTSRSQTSNALRRSLVCMVRLPISRARCPTISTTWQRSDASSEMIVRCERCRAMALNFSGASSLASSRFCRDRSARVSSFTERRTFTTSSPRIAGSVGSISRRAVSVPSRPTTPISAMRESRSRGSTQTGFVSRRGCCASVSLSGAGSPPTVTRASAKRRNTTWANYDVRSKAGELARRSRVSLGGKPALSRSPAVRVCSCRSCDTGTGWSSATRLRPLISIARPGARPPRSASFMRAVETRTSRNC